MTEEEIKKEADILFDQAFEHLRNDGGFGSTMFFQDQDGKMTFSRIEEDMLAPGVTLSKRTAFMLAALFLRQIQAPFVILINDGYLRKFNIKDDAEKHVANYKDGDLSVDPEAQEALIVSFKGKGLTTGIKTIEYHRDELGEIQVDERLEWVSNAEFNLLPDWWEKDDETTARKANTNENQHNH